MDELPPPPQPNPWAAPVPPSIPTPGTPTPPRTKRSPAVKIAAVLAAILVAGAAITGIQMALGNSKTASLPDAVGSYQRLNTVAVQRAHDSFDARTKQLGFEADAAVYGTGSTPRFMLAWIRDATVDDPDTALTSFASGFAQGFGGTIAIEQKRTHVLEGTTFVCAPITGSSLTAICLWQQREVFYLLFDSGSGGNLNTTLGLSAKAHRVIG